MQRIRSSRSIIFTVVALGATAAAALASPKDQIPEKQRAASQAQSRLEALSEQLEPAIEEYNRRRVELAAVETEIANTKRVIRVTQGNLRVSQDLLEDRLVASYRLGDSDLLSVILASESIETAVDSVDLMRRSQSQVVGLIDGLRVSQAELGARRKKLAADEQQAEQLAAQAAAAKQSIQSGIAEQQALIEQFSVEIEQLQAEERVFQERLRTQAERRLAAARAAAAEDAADNPDPGIGGSAGPDTPVAPAPNPTAPDGGGGGGSSGGDGGSSGGGSVAPPPADGSIGSQVVAAAMGFLGIPYVYGGASRSGMDCSGMTMLAYQAVGISLDHFTGSQWNSGPHVGLGDLAPGDLVFFYSDLHHVGIYIGGMQFIHAPHTGDVVKISSLQERIDRGNYAGAVRPYA